MDDQLADPRGRSANGVVSFLTTGQHEPCGTGHLDDRRSAVEPPPGPDRVAQWTGDEGLPVGATKDVERALPAIGQRPRDEVPAATLRGALHRSRNV